MAAGLVCYYCMWTNGHGMSWQYQKKASGLDIMIFPVSWETWEHSLPSKALEDGWVCNMILV